MLECKKDLITLKKIYSLRLFVLLAQKTSEYLQGPEMIATARKFTRWAGYARVRIETNGKHARGS